MGKKLWNSVRNLPRNLRTLRPVLITHDACRFDRWGISIETDPGDEYYPLHFSEAVVYFPLPGNRCVHVGIEDTN